MHHEVINYKKSELHDWKEKKLLKKWKDLYPELIHSHMYSLFMNRKSLTSRCFYELYAGVYYVEMGYKFIFEPWFENFLLKPVKKKNYNIYKKVSKKYLFVKLDWMYTISSNKRSRQKFRRDNLIYLFIEMASVSLSK